MTTSIEIAERLAGEWDPDKVRIWKLRGNGEPRSWYCWDMSGYSYDLGDAGLYDRDEAENHVRGCTSELAVKAIGVEQVDPKRYPIDALLYRLHKAEVARDLSMKTARRRGEWLDEISEALGLPRRAALIEAVRGMRWVGRARRALAAVRGWRA